MINWRGQKMTPEQEIKLLKELLYCTKRSCNNCGKVNCENFQRQRIDCCGHWVSYKDYIKELEQQIEKMKRHCNCKHRDSEGYCEVKRTYLMDLSYDGCDKWELED